MHPLSFLSSKESVSWMHNVEVSSIHSPSHIQTEVPRPQQRRHPTFREYVESESAPSWVQALGVCLRDYDKLENRPWCTGRLNASPTSRHTGDS
eukprot:1122257-Amphidinium_carterae.1